MELDWRILAASCTETGKMAEFEGFSHNLRLSVFIVQPVSFIAFPD